MNPRQALVPAWPEKFDIEVDSIAAA